MDARPATRKRFGRLLKVALTDPRPGVSQDTQFWLITKLALAVDMIVNGGWSDPDEEINDDSRAEMFIAVVTRALRNSPQEALNKCQCLILHSICYANSISIAVSLNSSLTLCFVSDSVGFYWRRQAVRQAIIHLATAPYPFPHFPPLNFGGLAVTADNIIEELYRVINNTNGALVRV